jgi:hypothetical protein
MRGKVKWEGMWVIFVECVAYAAALVSPDADFVSIRLTNGLQPLPTGPLMAAHRHTP